MKCGSSAYIALALISGTPFFVAAGCGKSSADHVATKSESAQDSGDAATPEAAADPAAAATVVHEFLQAVKTGDETRSNELLTPLARQKTAEQEMAVAPMGSESASFTVGEVELPEEGNGELAHVASTWTDVDEDGEPHTDEILWVLRHDKEGWRVGGMATKVFEDQPPLLLDFENPVDMRRKQQLAEAEMERRSREAVDELPEEPLEHQSEQHAPAPSGRAERQAVKPTRPNRNK